MANGDKTPENSRHRKQVPPDVIDQALDAVRDQLRRRLEQKGYGTWSSSHEILGQVAEEYTELTLAVQAGDGRHVAHELTDIAVAGIFGVACLMNGSTDW